MSKVEKKKMKNKTLKSKLQQEAGFKTQLINEKSNEVKLLQEKISSMERAHIQEIDNMKYDIERELREYYVIWSTLFFLINIFFQFYS